MAATLTPTFTGDAVTYRVTDSGVPVPVEQWAIVPGLLTPTGDVARTGTLTRLLAEDRAVIGDEGLSLAVPAALVAGLPASRLAALALPPAAPFSLQLSKTGLITSPGFDVQARFIAAGGRPLLSATRTGAHLSAGTKSYTLLDPLHAALEAIDKLRAAPDENARFAALGELQEHVPEGALTDPYLTSIRIVRADTFTLRLDRSADGSVVFDPVPLRRVAASVEHEEERPPEPRQVLPEERQQEWAGYFRRVTPRSKMPAGRGWYVTTSPMLQRAFEVIKEQQSASPEQRKAFARNPRVVLRDRLLPDGAPVDDDEALEEVEALFAELGAYGARVTDVGLWQPAEDPVVRGGQQLWLPDELIYLRTGDVLVSLQPGRAEALLDELQVAHAEAVASIQFDGKTIPVNDETLAAAHVLASMERKDEAPTRGGEEEASERLVALTEANIDDVRFRRTPRASSGTAGELPTRLATTLFDFQLDGYRWLQELWIAGAPGGILADDMGLGKTVQTLAFLAWIRERHGGQKPILVVGPTGLLRNWRAEHDIHLRAPGLGSCLEAHGQELARLRIGRRGRGGELEAGLPSLDLEALKSANWVLTTYENLRDYQHSFAQVPWLVTVFDEAQRVKNPFVMTTQAAQAIESDFTLAVTGTPVENQLRDLWSIADIVQPGVLGSLKSFSSLYESSGGADERALSELREIVQERDPPPMMLRRLKVDHLKGLPPITRHVTRRVMPALQAERYAHVVAQSRRDGAMTEAKMLQALQGMRSVSLHPMEDVVVSDDQYIAASARLSLAIEVLDRLHQAGEKALIFVEYLAVQAVLTELLQRRYQLPAPPIVINGAVAGPKRKDRVDVFQERRGFDVMLLSPRAGGVGLTITAANHVIHLSRWWNPAVEDQATDRVYRIGQKREVHVHVPLAIHPQLGEGSFDALLHTLLERKRALSRGVLATPVASGDDLKNLFDASVRGDQ